jgi:hypothetical protein
MDDHSLPELYIKKIGKKKKQKMLRENFERRKI